MPEGAKRDENGADPPEMLGHRLYCGSGGGLWEESGEWGEQDMKC